MLGMKRRLLAVLTILMPFALIGCTDGSWKDYNTPDRFLKKAATSAHRFTICLGEDERKYSSHRDYNLEIRDALVSADEFKKTDQSSSKSSRYFNYVCRYSDGYVGLAPALYCTMSVYDDGFINIHFETLKEDKYAYYKMDAEQSYVINDLIREKYQEINKLSRMIKNKLILTGM